MANDDSDDDTKSKTRSGLDHPGEIKDLRDSIAILQSGLSSKDEKFDKML